MNPYEDIFALLETGLDPPAPLLSAVLLRGRGKDEAAARVYRKLLSAEDEVEEKTEENSRRIVHILMMLAEVQAIIGSAQCLQEALRLLERVEVIYKGDKGGQIVPDGGATPPTIGIETDEDRRALAATLALMARCLHLEKKNKEAAEKWKAVLSLYGEVSTEEVADSLFALAQLHWQGFGLGDYMKGMMPAPVLSTGSTDGLEVDAASSMADTTQASTADTVDDETTVVNTTDQKIFTLDEVKARAAADLLQKALEIETAINGPGHVRTDQIRTMLEEVNAPLTWIPPRQRPGDSMLDRLLGGEYIPELQGLRKEEKTENEGDDGEAEGGAHAEGGVGGEAPESAE